MEDVQADAREALDEDWDGIIAHELFHQWFGDLVTCESWGDLALNEGFATYGAVLWAEKRDGPDGMGYALINELQTYLREARFKQDPIIQHHYHDPDDLFDSHRYAKAGLVLHMLRELAGDEAFFAALKLYLTRHRHQTVELADLRQPFEQVTGQDLSWFFDQWFLRPGHPVLEVSSRYANGQVQLLVTQKQDTLKAGVYRLPLEVAVWVNGKEQLIPVTVAKARQEFVLPAAAAPNLVLFDARQQLLGEVKHQKTRPELLFQARHAIAFRARYEALMQLENAVGEAEVREAVLKALQSENRHQRLLAIDLLENYEGEAQDRVGAALAAVAAKDPVRPVRAAAIGTLAALPSGKAYLPVFQAGLLDSSYSVVAASVLAYGKAVPAEAAARFEPLESLSQADVVLALGRYYAEQQVKGKSGWFQARISQVRSWPQSLLLNTYGQYLLQQDAATQREALPGLEQLALRHPRFQIRLAAYQTLDLLDKAPEAQAARKRIKEAETDPRLRQVYQSMP